MRNLLATIGVGVCLAAMAVPAAAGKKKKKEKKSNPAAVALFEKATAASDIEAKGAPAFRLQASARIFGAHKKHANAVMVQFWEPTGQWREETMTGDYKLVTVFDGQNQWAKGTLGYVPFPVYELWAALRFPNRLREQFGKGSKWGPSWQEVNMNVNTSRSTAPHLAKPRREKGSQECVKDDGAELFRGEFCFNAASGDLVSQTNRITRLRYEYADYASFGQKSFPRVIRVFSAHKKELLEIHVSRIDPLTKPAPTLFLPPKGSQEELSQACGLAGAAKMKKAGYPPFPQSATGNQLEGTVVFYGNIGINGTLQGLWPVRSPWPRVAGMLTQVLRLWRYNPSTCQSAGKARAVPTPTFIVFKFGMEQ